VLKHEVEPLVKIRDFNIQGAPKFSSFIKPMLATTSDKPFNNADWIFEIKWDGYRAISEINGNDIKLYSRNGLSFAKAYPKIIEALKEINLPCVLDGEIVVLDKNGNPTFNSIQNYDPKSKATIIYYVFDCLEMNGIDLKGLPLINRKELVKELIGDSEGVIRYNDHVIGDGKTLFEQAVQQNLEGIIAKKAKSKYTNDRSQYWLKIKNFKSEEFVVVGYLSGKGSRQYFGGLILAEKQGRKFLYRGHAGSGFTDKQLKETFELLQPDIIDKCPLTFLPKFDSSKPTWVAPKYFCSVRYTEITDEDVLRHPVFLGLRVDKEV
jgi:bifunctional non-homologous end joining protein LigD